MSESEKDQASVKPAPLTPSRSPQAGAQTNGPASQAAPSQPVKPQPAAVSRKPEIGGPKGPEPTRYGDWEKNGRCVDF